MTQDPNLPGPPDLPSAPAGQPVTPPPPFQDPNAGWGQAPAGQAPMQGFPPTQAQPPAQAQPPVAYGQPPVQGQPPLQGQPPVYAQQQPGMPAAPVDPNANWGQPAGAAPMGVAPGAVPATPGAESWGYYPPASGDASWLGAIGAGAIGWIVYSIGWIISVLVSAGIALASLGEDRVSEFTDAMESQDSARIESAINGLGDQILVWAALMVVATVIMIAIALVIQKLLFGAFNKSHTIGWGAAILAALGGWVAGCIGLMGDAVIGLSFGLISLTCASVATGAILRTMAKLKTT